MPEVGTATVTVVVDGRPVEARPGEKLIAAAERAGIYIPRFCYHPRMRPVGMCRMCLVEVRGPRGFSLQPACYLDVADGQEVRTRSEKVRKAQDGVLEFLLVNHPLDCPVCDKGGECPLQDQTLVYGPGESRFVDEKVHFAKPVALSELVLLDRERCIQCDRCTRFAAEVAGEAEISFAGRGDRLEVAIFPGRPFGSYFSGNTVQICPVGALTAVPYRFKARPWDLEQVESTCTTCSVGCRVAVQSSENRVVRLLGVDADPVNHSWLCDKGRYGYEALASPARLAAPLVRRGEGLVEASYPEALSVAAAGLAEVIRLHGPSAVAVLGGARLPNEDAYAWAKLAKGVIGTDSVDAQLGDGLPAEVVLGLPRATIDEAAAARVLLVMAGDLREQVPVLYLRLRQAVAGGGPRLVEVGPTASALSPLASCTLRHRPGAAAALARALVGARSVPDTAAAHGVSEEALAAARALLGLDGAGSGGEAGRRGEGVVVVLGRPSLAEPATDVAEAAAVLAAALPGLRFLPALRRANVHGALDLGLAPGVLPGRVGLEEGRAFFTEAWGKVPAERGLDARGVLEAVADGRVGALVLLGADPLADFPDRRLARAAFEAVGFLVAVDGFLTASSQRADVVLPAALWAERGGTTTNLEGRVSRLAQKVVPPGLAWPDWMIAVELARRLGGDLGFDTLEDIWQEIERLSPAHRGITAELLASAEAHDGIVAPLGSAPTSRPRPIDPVATPGVGSVATQGSPSDAGASLGPGDEDRPSRRAPAATPPPMLRPPQVAQAGSPPPLDRYSLRLVVDRRLYDGGTLVQACPSLAPLAPAPRLRTNPAELARLGLRAGERVRVASARGSLVLEAEADPGIPEGVAALAANLPGNGAADLVDAAATTTDVRLETLG
jgi:NADH-quinone oxidoreductase subunit G